MVRCNAKRGCSTYTYGDYLAYRAYATNALAEVKKKWREFAKQLHDQDPTHSLRMAVSHYYNSRTAAYNGKLFQEDYITCQNRQSIGQVAIKKQNFFVQDTWQMNQNTIVSPIFRVDPSDLFGTNATFNMGLTHNIGGKANRRFKANVGTGYTEPGMGELYYSWEMYAGMPSGMGEGRLGYYWIGNPDLKPEKSVNFDIGIEGENGKTSARINIFHNRIKDYMSTYFTGEVLDFNPPETDWDKKMKWLTPPDMIYSFRNIGKAEITGLEAEVTQQFDEHWSGKLGYTYLHAINKSDPDMPKQLLDKPQHKVDIGVTYENNASLWGDYYIHMLDSNSVTNNGNYLTYDKDGNIQYGFSEKGKWGYQKKTFGLWNILFQKKYRQRLYGILRHRQSF